MDSGDSCEAAALLEAAAWLAAASFATLYTEDCTIDCVNQKSVIVRMFVTEFVSYHYGPHIERT